MGSSSLSKRRLSLAGESDLYLDYVARPYEPQAPWKGKLRSEALYDAGAAGRPALLELKDRLQKRLGKDRVVWGVKERLGQTYWELYFYNYDRRPELSVESVRRALAPDWSLAPLAAQAPEHMMFSFELSDAVLASRRVEAYSIYEISEAAGRVVSRSWRADAVRAVPENVYIPVPLDTPRDRALLEKLLRRGLGAVPGLDGVLPPKLMAGCRSVCLASKPRGGKPAKDPNGVYLSTLRVDALLEFLRQWRYPEALVAFVADNRDRLDHLLYDVGYDFDGGDAVSFCKSGFYGIF
jgi:hypothetical protein